MGCCRERREVGMEPFAAEFSDGDVSPRGFAAEIQPVAGGEEERDLFARGRRGGAGAGGPGRTKLRSAEIRHCESPLKKKC